jgi:hypothetical protein
VQSAYTSTPLIIAVACGALFGVLLIIVLLVCLYSSMRRAIARSAQLIQANRNKNMALDLLHEAKRISDEANRSKSDFLAFLCHELRNPLHVRAHPHFAPDTRMRTLFSIYRRNGPSKYTHPRVNAKLIFRCCACFVLLFCIVFVSFRPLLR